MQVRFHSSAYPDATHAALRQGLRAGVLPGHWLYHSPAQAQRWLDYHQACSPSRADASLAALYRAAFAAVAHAGKECPRGVVGLGAGGGRKDADLLAALARAGAAAGAAGLTYTPVDASPALVLAAALHVRARLPGVALRPVVADLEAAPALGAPRGLRSGARVLTCFGILPNLDPARLLPYLRSLARPGDALLLSANLSPRGFAADRDQITAQYENPPARRWYAGALEALGLGAEDYALAVTPRPTTADGSAWEVEVTATLTGAHSLDVFGERFHFGPGRPLRVFVSRRWTRAAAEALLKGAGLSTGRCWLHPSGEEAIFRCEPEGR